MFFNKLRTTLLDYHVVKLLVKLEKSRNRTNDKSVQDEPELMFSIWWGAILQKVEHCKAVQKLTNDPKFSGHRAFCSFTSYMTSLAEGTVPRYSKPTKNWAVKQNKALSYRVLYACPVQPPASIRGKSSLSAQTVGVNCSSCQSPTHHSLGVSRLNVGNYSLNKN